LTATTGLIDAVAFLGLGRVFTANMTGNVVFLAFAIAGAQGLSSARRFSRSPASWRSQSQAAAWPWPWTSSRVAGG
jgi:hypothetical protein